MGKNAINNPLKWNDINIAQINDDVEIEQNAEPQDNTNDEQIEQNVEVEENKNEDAMHSDSMLESNENSKDNQSETEIDKLYAELDEIDIGFEINRLQNDKNKEHT